MLHPKCPALPLQMQCTQSPLKPRSDDDKGLASRSRGGLGKVSSYLRGEDINFYDRKDRESLLDTNGERNVRSGRGLFPITGMRLMQPLKRALTSFPLLQMMRFHSLSHPYTPTHKNPS